MKNFTYPVEVRFCDLDSLGHINNAVYLSYFELCRIRWLKSTKISDLFGSRVPLILAHTAVDYIAPVLWEDSLSCEVCLEKVGNKSFSLSYELKKNSKQICTKAISTQVWFDYDKQVSVQIPEKVRLLLAS